MRNRFFGFVAAVPFLFSSALAQQTDTVDSKTVEVVDVTSSVVGVVTITSADIQLLHPIQASEVLKTIPGLFVKDFGGLGGVKTVSMRGGSSAQTLVTLNGLRMNSAQNGGVDLSIIPASFINSVKVKRGSMSAIEGASAMNGSINLELSLPDDTYVNGVGSAGSFNEWRTNVAASVASGESKFGAAFEAYGSDGSYGYNIDADGESVNILRSNADVRAISSLLRYEIDDASNVTLLARTGERGVPGAVVQGATEASVARLVDIDVILNSCKEIEISKSSSLELGLSGRYLDQHYTDPSSTITGPQGIDAQYITRDVVFAASLLKVIAPLTFKLKADAAYTDLRGEFIQDDIGEHPDRRSAGCSVSSSWESDSKRTRIEAAFRADYYSDVGGNAALYIGGKTDVDSTIELRASIGTGYRPPSFNELYYLNYGNTDLKSETSATASVGFNERASLFGDVYVVTDVEIFASRISNLIVSVPVNPVSISAQNVGSANSIGGELKVDALLLNNALQVGWAYSLQSVTDKTGRTGLDGTAIPYTPMEMFSVNATLNQGSSYGQIFWSYTGFRYAQPGEEYTSLLSAFHTVNVIVGTKALGRTVNADVSLHVLNIFNEQYSVIRGFPMPGRIVRVVLSVFR